MRELINSRYAEWLQGQGLPLYRMNNMYWRLYQGAIVPAPVTVCFTELSRREALALLKESGAYFIRYASNPSQIQSDWWYMICSEYDPSMLSSNTRSKINRGKKKCAVNSIDSEWLANNGYRCYVSAFTRYSNFKPLNEELFRKNILSTSKGPFEYWGVFIEGKLAGYCQCVVEENEVATNVFKYDPSFLRNYTAYSLIDALLTHYITECHMNMSNGTRAVAHDTNMQDFLLKFGFRKAFCRLNIVYQQWLGLGVNTLFPLRELIARLPQVGPIHRIQSLLFQEGLRRNCQNSAY